MPISRMHKILFIHIFKTGGKSVEALLRQHFPLKHGGKYHSSVHAFRKRWRQHFDDYYSFAFVRNPWDRLVSAWAYQQRRHPRRARQFKTFADFVIYHIRGTNHLLLPQADLLCDTTGKLLVTQIYRFESFATECQRLLADIGVPTSKIPHRNASKHAHYSTYYTRRLRKMVARYYARDIAIFGYTFERTT